MRPNWPCKCSARTLTTLTARLFTTNSSLSCHTTWLIFQSSMSRQLRFVSQLFSFKAIYLLGSFPNVLELWQVGRLWLFGCWNHPRLLGILDGFTSLLRHEGVRMLWAIVAYVCYGQRLQERWRDDWQIDTHIQQNQTGCHHPWADWNYFWSCCSGLSHLLKISMLLKNTRKLQRKLLFVFCSRRETVSCTIYSWIYLRHMFQTTSITSTVMCGSLALDYILTELSLGLFNP